MSGRYRRPSREFRRITNHRSRSCDSSRSRHYINDTTLNYPSNNKSTKKPCSRRESPRAEYTGYDSPKRTTKRPYRQQGESVSVKRKHRRLSRTESENDNLRSRKSSYEREKENKLYAVANQKYDYKVNTKRNNGAHYKHLSSSCPRNKASVYNKNKGSNNNNNSHRRNRRHSDSSYSHSSSDDGYRSLEIAKPPKSDAEGHLIYKKGDWIQGRYELLSTLGEGAFGRVIKCVDHDRNGRRVALKVIKNVAKYREEAKLEIKVLETIMDKDRKFRSGCIFLLDWFNFHGFVCLAFDLLGKSIYDYLKDNSYYPYPMKHIKKIAQQLGSAVKFLHDHGMTHTDLKPENILFADSSYEIMWNVDKNREEKILRSCDIKLIDFGSTTFDDEHHTKIVQTRHYRAPEVILELGWCQSCDVWSVGCILFELYTGETMFLTHDNHEHLAMMTYILGRLPSTMIKKSKKTKYFYHGRLNWDFDERSSSNKYIKQHCKPLSRCLKHRNEEDELLMELLWDCLEYDPEHRLTMSQYSKHEYFNFEPNNTTQSSKEQHDHRRRHSRTTTNTSTPKEQSQRTRTSRYKSSPSRSNTRSRSSRTH